MRCQALRSMGSSEDTRGPGPLASRGLLWGRGWRKNTASTSITRVFCLVWAGPCGPDRTVCGARMYQSGWHLAFLSDVLISAPCFSLPLMLLAALLCSPLLSSRFPQQLCSGGSSWAQGPWGGMAASEGWAPSPCGGPLALLSSAGLSSESWSIMKNMATELGIILIGYFTLVPAIQVRPQGLPRG